MYLLLLLFTFQSGDIQIKNMTYEVSMGLGEFTFQSGDIQIFFSPLYLVIKKNLHSNLVIFKLHLRRDFCNDDILFTFQSGDIQMFLVSVLL